jgi:GntR family histidine utilization transcriptional repressor
MHNSRMSDTPKRYTVVKDYVLAGISNGSWGAGERVPSENELVDLCQVSRMTARRALDELLQAGTLIRIKGKGSFVSEEKQQSSLLQIRSIAAEIREQGFRHHSQLLGSELNQTTSEIETALELSSGDICAHSQLLHFQNELPIQLEYRWVNSELAPEYHLQDFSQVTPSEYLSSIAPVTEAEHLVEAIIGSPSIRRQLQVKGEEAVLLLSRKTWCNGKLVSFAKLYHPGDRYRLGTKFKTD